MLKKETVARIAASLYRACHQHRHRYNNNPLSLKPYSSSKTPDSETLETDMKTVDEEDVGICCYVSQLPGFRGVLKQRYADFIVNEVGLGGDVVHLTNLEAPPEVLKENEIKVSDEPNKSYDTEIESFKSLTGDSDANSLKDFVQQIISGDKDKFSPIILSPSSDKAHRTAVHNFFKEHFKFLETDTVDGPDLSSKCIRVRFKAGGNSHTGRNSKKRKDRGGKPYDHRGSDNWPDHLHKFLRFHLYKENKDTQEALGLIGKMLGIQPRSFGFAGTKDKRSVSTQRVTVFKQHASRLASLNKRLIGIKVGDFCHVKKGLLLGQLYGNHFTITLRGVVANSETCVRESAEALGKHGFINYFGLQRFGSGSIPTHLIGASLLRGEWKTAVSMILDPREGEKDSTRKAREYYKESNDIDGTLKQLPRHMVAERAILQCLKKCPGNFLQALKAIPRTLRMMYVHSYQSYLWNHAASMRVQKYGIDQVVVGDLVYCKEECTEKAAATGTLECEDDSFNDPYECSQLDEIAETVLPEDKSNLVKVVDEQVLDAGHYTVEDVILPLPGSRVIYPLNDIGKVFHDLANKDGISLTESAHSVKEFSITNMTGGYRRVFQKPKDFEWELLMYTDGNIPLVETDLDICAKSLPATVVRKEELRNGYEGEKPKQFGDDKEVGSPQKQSEGLSNDTELDLPQKQSEGLSNDTELDLPQKQSEDLSNDKEAGIPQKQSNGLSNDQEAKMALKLSFTLPASCYATMAIRELLKTSTSVAFHKTLNE